MKFVVHLSLKFAGNVIVDADTRKEAGELIREWNTPDFIDELTPQQVEVLDIEECEGFEEGEEED